MRGDYMDITKVQSKFIFVGSRVVSFNLSNDFVSLPDENNLSLSLDVDKEISDFTVDDDLVFGEVNLTITVLAQSKDNDKQLSLTITVNGCFADNKDIDTEEFRTKLSINGSAALYSIARANIISITSQSLCGGQLIIPLINFFEFD